MDAGGLSAIFAAMYIHLKVVIKYHDDIIYQIKGYEHIWRIRSYGRT